MGSYHACNFQVTVEMKVGQAYNESKSWLRPCYVFIEAYISPYNINTLSSIQVMGIGR